MRWPRSSSSIAVAVAQCRGAAHGEVGQTQFLPANVIRFGVDGDGDGRVDLIGSVPDALASTAKLPAGPWLAARRRLSARSAELPRHPAWNAAGVYQQSIAIIGQRIDSR